jgi:hypothetical protein
MVRSNKKKGNHQTKGTTKIAWSPNTEALDAPDFYNEPFQRRPVPNMKRDPLELLDAIQTFPHNVLRRQNVLYKLQAVGQDSRSKIQSSFTGCGYQRAPRG